MQTNTHYLNDWCCRLSPLVSGVRDFTLVEMVDPNAQSIEYPDEMKEIFMEVVSDTALRAKINELRKLCDTERCLIHSDNHHGSIFLGQGRAVVRNKIISCLWGILNYNHMQYIYLTPS